MLCLHLGRKMQGNEMHRETHDVGCSTAAPCMRSRGRFVPCRARNPVVAYFLLNIIGLSFPTCVCLFVDAYANVRGKLRVGFVHNRYEAFEKQHFALSASLCGLCAWDGLSVDKYCANLNRHPLKGLSYSDVQTICMPTSLYSSRLYIWNNISVLSNAASGIRNLPTIRISGTPSHPPSLLRIQRSSNPLLQLESKSLHLWRTRCGGMELWGAASNRINGKPPAVLPSPSPFPAALLHLPFKPATGLSTQADGEVPGNRPHEDNAPYYLQSKPGNRRVPGGAGGAVLPSSGYTGRLSRLPCSPSIDLYLLGAPARLFRAKSVVIRAHARLREPGLPILRSRWFECEEEERHCVHQGQKQKGSSESNKYECGDDSVHLRCNMSFDSLVREGDRYPERKRFGEVASLFQPSKNYGKPSWPSMALDAAKEYNEQMDRAGTPEKKIPQEVKYDTIFCDENGYVVRIYENRPPYDGSEEPEEGGTTWELYKLRREHQVKRPAHTFIVSAPAGFVKEKGIKVGDRHPAFEGEAMQRVFNNHFALPRKYREPLLLPDGRIIP